LADLILARSLQLVLVLEIVFDNLDFADLGSGFGGGSGSTGGGIGGGGGDGPSESAENPSDGGDATPLGPFENPPVPGGPRQLIHQKVL
jgi:hypothetical protein